MFFSLEELDAISPYISQSKEKTIKNLCVAVRFLSKEKRSAIINDVLFKITEMDDAEYQYLYALVTDGNE